MSETAAVGCRFCSQYSRFWSSFRWSPSAARSDRRESDAAPRTGGRLVMVVIFDGLRHLCGRRIRHFRDRSRRIRPGHLGIIAPVHNPAALVAIDQMHRSPCPGARSGANNKQARPAPQPQHCDVALIRDGNVAQAEGDRPATLYLVVPSSDISSTKPLVRLILNQIGRCLTEDLVKDQAKDDQTATLATSQSCSLK